MAVKTPSTWVWSQAYIDFYAAQLLAGVPAILTWDGGNYKLYKSSLSPTKNTAGVAFTAAEATFPGYAAVVVGSPAIVNMTTGDKATFNSASFVRAAGAGDSESIGGAWYEDSNGDLIGYWPFDEPVTITNEGDFIDVNGGVPWQNILQVVIE